MRDVTQVGPGDYIKVKSGDQYQWKEIAINTAHRANRVPKFWVITTTDGQTHTMWDINLYAKVEDVESLDSL